MAFSKMLAVTTALTLSIGLAADADAFSKRKQQEQWPAWYIGLHGGVSFVHETDVEVNSVSAGDASFDLGTAFGGSLGYQYSRTLRFELEYSYRDAGFDTLDNGAGSTDLMGDLSANIFMANVLFDGFTPHSRWTPYIGGGLGVASIDFSSPTVNVGDTDNVFAYQFLTGLNYAPSSMPNTEWGFGYRFLGTAAPEFRNNAGQNVEHDFYSHSLEVNARFRF